MVSITIDGNIGAGKSTILSFLRDVGKYAIHVEPVEEWVPFLVDMYENNKDAFEFQVKVWTDRCFMPQYSPKLITCIERSPHFQWNVFSKANYENGKLNERHMSLLETLYHRPSYTPDLYIYLQSDPNNCMKRIQKRERKCEQGIPTEYVSRIHELHEQAFATLPKTAEKVCIHIEHKTIEEIGWEVLLTIRQYLNRRKSIDDEHF